MTSRKEGWRALPRRRFLACAGGAALAAPLSACALDPTGNPSVHAERILLGRVRVLDDRGTTAEALAIADSKVLAVGTRDDVAKRRGPATQVHDLGGAPLIPGVHYTHAHRERDGLKT